LITDDLHFVMDVVQRAAVVAAKTRWHRFLIKKRGGG